MEQLCQDIKFRVSVWVDPSDRLLELCKDVGCIQLGHTDLTRAVIKFDDDSYYEKYIDDAWSINFDNGCLNCEYYGYPCANFQMYCDLSPKLCEHWKYPVYPY